MSTLYNLTQMDKIPVEFTLDGMRALRTSEDVDQVKLADLQRQYGHESEMDPIRLADARRKFAYESEMDPLRIRQQQTGNQKGEFELSSLGRKDDMERSLFDQTKKTKLQELLASASDNEARVFENTLYERARAARPGSPEHKAILAALETTRGFQEEKRKHTHALEIAARNNATQIKLEQMRIDAGKYQKAQDFKIGFRYELNKADNATKINAVLTKYLSMAQYDPDLKHLIPMLNEMLDRNEAPYRAETDAMRRQGAGGIDAGAVTGLPVRPPAPIQAPPVPAPTAGGQPPSQAQPTPAPEAKPSTPAVPKPGEVRQGYRFKGGDPSKQANWEKI